jgi:hypothetical protein
LKASAFRAGFAESDTAMFHSAPLKLQSPVLGASGGINVVTWSSMTGQTYRVQYSPDFTYWINISSNVTGTGSSSSFTNHLILSHPRWGFIRVVGQ